MIYARFSHSIPYGDFHDELLEFVKSKFTHVESGHQGDSWIWIFNESERVEIDTFYSMVHEIKTSHAEAKLVKLVIQALSEKYELQILSNPEAEPHE